MAELPDTVFTDHAAEEHIGKWRETFSGKPEKLHVEVGCNAGHVILEWAKQNPETAFIGVDWKIKAIHRAGEKAEKRALGNVKFLRAHALRLQYIFGKGEIDRLAIYFPDPWPKKAQWKYRWVTAERLRILADLVKKGGEIHIKTDHPGYFEWMEEALKNVTDQWQVMERTRNLHEKIGQEAALKLDIPEVTLFEKLFIRDEIPIQSLWLKRV
jgi:tRNA (guanine-N7-)-methyltransferase